MGNRSSSPNARGVGRTLVRLPGFHVKGLICIPQGPSHSLWLLAWVEQLLKGRSLDEVVANPPWPAPGDPLISRQLVRELIDLRWVVPDWSGTGVRVASHLADSFAGEGRVGLARALFDAEVLPGEWWMDAYGGALLSRQTAAQFDWDLKRRADEVLDAPSDAQALVDGFEPDLADLVAKLGASQRMWEARDRAFLAAPLVAGTGKDILFTLFGDDLRVLPDELAELEPVLMRHAPKLFGQGKAVRSRVVRLPRSRVEQIEAEIERLPTDAVTLGPLAPVRTRLGRIAEQLRSSAGELEQWLANGQAVRPVVGPTQRHFDALAELCAEAGEEGWVLLTSAFLNDRCLAEDNGLVAALEEAPGRTRFLLVYGHASDDLPAEQQQDMDRWLDVLRGRSKSVAERMTIVAGTRRSHEKVVVTSAGDWMVGSWNPASSRPNATVFECSVTGRSAAFAGTLVDRVGRNVEGEAATAAVAAIAASLRPSTTAPTASAPQHREAVSTLLRAVGLLEKALPADGIVAPNAWSACVRALRAAWHPFLASTHVDLVDEQQTRDVFHAQVRSARREVLLASDRLADSALDGATLRDLRGDGRSRPVVRVVWGREWAGQRPAQQQARDQIRRAQEAIREAREVLGPALCTSNSPMENHAKVLLVDGLRGLVTSENLLSFGGEKGRYESRELGVAFSSPVLTRHLLGRFLHHWPGTLAPSLAPGPVEQPFAWIVAAHEAWHALATVADEVDFDWQAPRYVGAVVREDVELAQDDQSRARAAALADLERRVGTDPFPWLREEAERLGLARVSATLAWRPYDAPEHAPLGDLLAAAEREVSRSHPVAPLPRSSTSLRTDADPLVERLLADMVRIPAGRFRMGDDRVQIERPRHVVVISRPFLLGRTPVTQGLWKTVMGSLPHLRDVERHPEFPIIQVDYREIRSFLEKLNARAGRARFELPTEAQWEYACRAGSDATYCFGDAPGHGDEPGLLERFAWTKRNAGARLQRVGALQANAWGLHDMHGLVYETVRDGFREYTAREVVDPVGPLDGRRIVARGGGWGRFPLDRRGSREAEHFRCASRQTHEKSHRVSFRIMTSVEDET